MLMGWGMFGWITFLAKRFTDSIAVQKVALFTLKGNFIVGMALLGLSGWKTASRDQCSVQPTYFQCYFDSNPTTLQAWYNSAYKGQSRSSYMLAVNMMWLSHTTSKFLDSDLKFSKKDDKKDKKDKPAKGGKAGPKADPKKGSKEESGLGPVIAVDDSNGTLHAHNGDVLFIKNGIVVAENGKKVNRPATKAEKDLLKK